jgi:hypothetical protein
MMKSLGVNLAKLRRSSVTEQFAAQNLAVQFGWLPLISDLGKLLDFADHVERKRNEIDRLFQKGGLRRNVKLGETSGNYDAATTVAIHRNKDATRRRTFSKKMWGSVRWKPTLPGLAPYYKSKSLAFRAALGLGLELHTVWEALPWSWLIDYFTSIGDYLAAHRNIVPAKPSRICIMRMDQLDVTFVGLNNKSTWMSYSGGASQRLNKTRTIGGSATLNANLPFLDGRRLSILASLLVLYRGKRVG